MSTDDDRRDVPPVLQHPSVKTRARVLGPCVVLAPLDQRLGDDLLRTLDAQGLSPRVEHDCWLAMAEACLLRREARQVRSTGAPAEPAPLVMLDEPDAQASDMLQSMARHVPDIPVLRYADGALHVVAEATAPEDDAEPPVIIQPPRNREVSDDELASLLPGTQEHRSG